MSKKLFITQTFALDDKDQDGELTGKFKGVAYSGQPISYHSGFENLITDVSKMQFKKKVPIFLHHDPTKIAGYAVVSTDNSKVVIEEGQISKSTPSGQEVLNLAREGFTWEFSIGYSYEWDDIEIVKDEVEFEVNGYKSVGPATIIKNSWLQEVSFVPVGADKQTVAEIFKKQNNEKGNKMSKIEFDKKAWEKFACGCGGNAESSLEELADVMIDEADLKALQDENAALKSEIAAMRSQMEEMSAKDKEEELSKLAKEKGIELSVEKIKEYSLDPVKAEMFIEFANTVTAAPKKIDEKFTKKVVLDKELPKGDLASEKLARITKAKELMKSGKAKTLPQALLMVSNLNK